MSELSNYINNRLNNRYGSAGDLNTKMDLSSGAWYHPPKNNDDDNLLQAMGYGFLNALGNAAGTVNDAIIHMSTPPDQTFEEWREKKDAWGNKNLVARAADLGYELADKTERNYTPWTANRIASGVAGIIPYAAALGVTGAAAARTGGYQNLANAAAMLSSRMGMGGKAAQAAGKVIPAVTVGAAEKVPEAMFEWQDAYNSYMQEAKQNGTYQKGVTEKEAEQNAFNVGLSNVGLLTATGGLEQFLAANAGKNGRFLKGLLSNIGTNAVEEVGQTGLPEWVRGESADTDELLESGLIGAVGGGAMHTGGYAANKYLDKRYGMPNASDPIFNGDIQKQIDTTNRAIDEGIQAGLEAGLAQQNMPAVQPAPAAAKESTRAQASNPQNMTKEQFFAAVAGQESGGNYDAENGRTGAYGKYQIMPDNWPSWSAEAGFEGADIKDPAAQEAVAKFKLGQYFDEYGPRGALVAWYAGPGTAEQYIENPNSEAWDRKQGNGDEPSINEYVDQTLGRIGTEMPSATMNTNLADVFQGVDENTTDDIFNDFAAELTDLGTENNNLQGLFENGKVDKEKQQEVLEAGSEEMADFLDNLIAKDDKKLAEQVASHASAHKDMEAYQRAMTAIRTNDVPVIKQIAGKYRQQLQVIRSRLVNNAPVDAVVPAMQPQQDAEKVPEQAEAPQEKPFTEQAPNNAQNEVVPVQQAPIQAQQPQPAQEAPAEQIVDQREQGAIAMAEIAQEKDQRVKQARAIQSVAAANNITIPKAVNTALNGNNGNAKAIQAAQQIIAPVLESNGGTVNESTEGIKTASAKSGNTENQSANTESEQGEAAAEKGKVSEHFTTGTRKIKNGEIRYSAKNTDRVDKETFAKLKDIANKYNGIYAQRAGAQFLFRTEADRDDFVAEASRMLSGEVPVAASAATQNTGSADVEGEAMLRDQQDRVEDFAAKIKTIKSVSNFVKTNAKSVMLKMLDGGEETRAARIERLVKSGYTRYTHKYEKQNDGKGNLENVVQYYLLSDADAVPIKVTEYEYVKYLNGHKDFPNLEFVKWEDWQAQASKKAPVTENASNVSGAKAASMQTSGKTEPKTEYVDYNKYAADKQAELSRLIAKSDQEDLSADEYLDRLDKARMKILENIPEDMPESEQMAFINNINNIYMAAIDKRTEADKTKHEPYVFTMDDETETETDSGVSGSSDKQEEKPQEQGNGKRPKSDAEKDAYATAMDDTLELLEKIEDNAVTVDLAKATLGVIKGVYTRSEPRIGDARKAESISRLFRKAENEIKKLEQAAAANENVFGDKAENDAEMLEALGISPDELSDEILTAPEGVVNTAAERERLEKELMAELNKLSANPVFNPKIYSLALQIGMTYVKDGINTAKKLVAKLNATFGDKIGPWAPAVAETISTWPKDVAFNEKQVMAVSKAIGSRFEEGTTSLEDVQADMEKLLKNRYKEFAPVIEASYNGIKKYYDAKEGTDNEQQGQSGSTAGRSEDVQTEEAEGNGKEGESIRPAGEVSGRSGRKGTGNSENPEGKDSKESEPGGIRIGAELEKTAGDGTGERGDKQPSTLTEAQKNPSPTETPGHDYEIKESAAGKTSAKKRFEQNIAAIKMLKKLETEDRMPTPSEQEILAAYNGWGGLKDAFLDGTKENTELKALLTDKEYNAAKATINDAFYTSPGLVRAIWEGVSHMGFKGGRVLDPSMGVGNFFGCMPREMMKKSDLRGVEIDNLTARFSKMLYPSAYVENTGFEKSTAPDNFFDLVISNIPFGQFKIDGYNIHNYFFANGIDKVRPGGLMVFITSQGSLASGQDAAKMRSYLAGKADMIAAYKLPSGAFSEAGTGVITDIVIMQKRGKDNVTSKYAQDFLSMDEVYGGYGYGGSTRATINAYFSEHPENVLGETSVKRNQYGEYAVDVTAKEGTKIEEELAKAMSKLPEGIYQKQTAAKTKAFDSVAAAKKARADEKTRDLEYYIKDGKVIQNKNGEAVEIPGKKKPAVVKAYIDIKNALNALLIAQRDPAATDKALASLRKQLNNKYDTFVGKFGYLNDTITARNYIDDPSAGMVMALEKIETTGTGKNKKISKVEKTAIFTERTMQAVREVAKVDSPSDALLASLANRGEVDLGYMAELLGSKPEKIAEQLKGQIFKNPMTEGYETREEYLSGNVREKLAHAKAAAKSDKSYEVNAKELEKVIPEDLVSNEIIVNMGAPWIPADDVQGFVDSVMSNGKLTVKYIAGIGQWSVDGWGNSGKYKVSGIGFQELIEKILNNKTITVSHKDRDGHTVVAQQETDAANLAAEQIRNDFREWLWQDKEREKRLVRYYNDNFNNSVAREYDGSHLGKTFPGMNSKWEMRPHQQNVVWRMLQKANTLIAHCVGAGKTAEMQAAGMEMRRLGIAKKPMYCLPNNVVEQFAREFRTLYPEAKLLVLQSDDIPAVKTRKTIEVTEDGRKKKKKIDIAAMPEKERNAYLKARTERNRTLARIQTEDWDAIIISHNMFERFPLTPETANAMIQEQLDVLDRTVKVAKGSDIGKRTLSAIENRKKSLEARMEEILNTELEDIGIPFEQLGIDQLFVDEADLFKNLPFVSSMDPVAGIGNPSSNRANDMFAKTQWLTRAMGGRGVVFATGTPISNTMAEMFTMMRYMDMQALKENGLDLFDNWVRTFAEIGSGIERKPSGDGFRKVTKVLRFINMPELTGMFRKFADVKNREDLNLDVPELKNGKATVVKIAPDPEILRYIKEEVPKRIRAMKGSFKKEKGSDNMLKLTGDLRKMSMTDTKIEACAEQIARVFDESTDMKGAQLVFCDLGIPKAKKNKKEKNNDIDEDDSLDDSSEEENASVYERLKAAIVAQGVPENQVGFVQSAKNKEQMDEMFQKVDKGELRILIGSTGKMGAGTNCQHHLVALHHMDAPWRPRDIEQREGRILRQGNPNKTVEIFNYVVQDSFDANMWEKLKNKAAIIAQAMSGSTAMRAVEDADLVTLSYAEVEGAATGNPLIKEQLDLNNQVTKYSNAQTAFKKQQRNAENALANLPQEKEYLEVIAGKIEDDVKNRKDTKGDAFTMKVGNKEFTERTKAEEALKKILDNFTKTTSTKIGEIGGFELKALYSEKGWSVGDETGSKVILQLVRNQAYGVNANSIQGIEATLKKGPDNKLSDCRNRLDKINGEIKEAEEVLRQESPYEAKLKELQQRLAEVNREIETTLVEGSQSQNQPVINEETGEIIGDDAQFSVTENRKRDSKDVRSLSQLKEDIREAFPNARNIVDEGDGIRLTLPNGATVKVEFQDKISISPEKAAKARREHGIRDEIDITVNGYTLIGAKKAFIALAQNGEKGTAFHEIFHIAYDMALTEKEKKAIERAFGEKAKAAGKTVIEYTADKYRDWKLTDRRIPAALRRLFEAVSHIIDNIRKAIVDNDPEIHEIFKRIESGEVWGDNNTAKHPEKYDKEYFSTNKNHPVQSGFSNAQIEDVRRKYQGTKDNNGEYSASNPSIKYSISPSDNSSGTWLKNIKNRFFGVKASSKDYQQMIKGIAEELSDMKIAWGKLDAGMDGVIKELEGVIRVKNPYDWQTTMPLVGKALAKRLGLKQTDEMANYIAEYLMNGAPNNTSPEADLFAEALKNNLFMSDRCMELRHIISERNRLSAIESIKSGIVFSPPKKSRKESFDNFRLNFYDEYVEELGPVKRMVEAIEKVKGSKVPDALNPYIAFRLFRGHYGKAMTMVEGMDQQAVNALKNVFPHVNWDGFKTIHMILADIGALDSKSRREDFMAYCTAKHMYDIHMHNEEIKAQIEEQKNTADELRRELDRCKERLPKSKIKMEIDMLNKEIEEITHQLEEAEDTIGKLEGKIMLTPEAMSMEKCAETISEYADEYDEAQQALVRYSNTLAAIQYDAGCVSERRYNNLLTKWPNYVPLFRNFEENENISYGDSMKQLMGSTRAVENPLGSIIYNSYRLIKEAEKNKAKLLMANLARCSDIGEFIEEVDVNGKPNLNDTVVFYEDGKRKYLVTDPSVVKAINRMGIEESDLYERLAHVPASIARACFTTINPSFAVRNLTRDVMDATIYSKYGFKPWDFIRGFIHAFKRDEVFYEWMASGAAMASAISIDRNYTQGSIDKMTKSWKEQVLSPKGLLELLQKAGEWSEYGTRIAAYERAKKAKGNASNGSLGIVEAALESRDLMDFARGGKASRSMNNFIIFANASIQGIDKFFRTFDFKNDRKNATKALARLVFTAMLPALALALLYRDEDWYKELPDWVKETHWILGKFGDTIIRIPKGQDIGIRLFSNFIEKAISSDKMTAVGVLKPLYDALPDMIPTAILPIVEVGANYSFFAGKPLVPGYLQRVPDEYQYNAMTSGLAKFVGKATGYSPIKIDHVINGYTGNMGKGTLQLIDWMGRDNKEISTEFSDAPVISGITYMPYKNPKSVQKFYDDLDEQTKLHALYNQTGNKPEGYDEAYYKALSKASRGKMSEYSKKERAAVNDQRLSLDRRYKIQRDIQQRRINTVKNILKKE